MNQQLAMIKFWLWAAMHSPNFYLFEIGIGKIIQVTSRRIMPNCLGEFFEISICFSFPRIYVHVDYNTEIAFTEAYPQYENAAWLSSTVPF